jgi:hypothetical protein
LESKVNSYTYRTQLPFDSKVATLPSGFNGRDLAAMELLE